MLPGSLLRACAIAFLMLDGGHAQQPQTVSTPGRDDQPLKVTTRLVQLSVVVHDRRGVPVGDLTKDDFQITNQGQDERIQLFTVDSLIPSATPPAAAGRAFFPRNVVTNRPARQTGIPTSVTVLLLDFYNTKLTDQMYNRRQIAGFLRQIRPEDRIAIYVLRANGFAVIHDFSNNPGSLMSSLARALPGFSNELEASEITPKTPTDADGKDPERIFNNSEVRMANFFTRNRVINTCLAFQVLARHLAGVPGRKNVVWLSGGFPIMLGFGDSDNLGNHSLIGSSASAIDREVLSNYVDSAGREMNTANAAVYPVDARGLMGLPMADASKRITMNPRTGNIADSYMHVDTQNIGTMNYIADLTGGKAYYNSNDIQGAIRKAIDDSSVTYTLGYYLAEERWDDKYHRIKVHVRRSGTSVRVKKGYLASEQKALGPEKVGAALREAIWSPLDSTQIGITAQVTPSVSVPGANRFRLDMDTSEITFRRDGERFSGSFDVVLAQQTGKGRILADKRGTINISVTPEQYTALAAEGISATEDLKLTKDTQAVRIVVLDRGSGLTGSVTVPVTAADKSISNQAPTQ